MSPKHDSVATKTGEVFLLMLLAQWYRLEPGNEEGRLWWLEHNFLY